MYFFRYNLTVHTVEIAADDKINKVIRPHLRTLLIGKAEDNRENKINSIYNSMDNVNRLEIHNPLHNWTEKDVWTFASSLYLPYKWTA